MVKENFKKRFRELFYMSGCASLAQFSRKLDLERQSVDRYYNGERCPDAPTLAKICEKMEISSDWLLGLSDVKSPSSDTRNIVNTLNLSEDAAVALQSISKNDILSESFSHLLEHGIEILLHYYKQFYKTMHLYHKEKGKIKTDNRQFIEQINENGSMTLDISEYISFYKFRTIEAMANICSGEQEYFSSSCDDSEDHIFSEFIIKQDLNEDRSYRKEER